MMDKEQFLASGLLEQYVLGIADPDEVREVERYLAVYPELHQEVEELRSAINAYAAQLSIPPPPNRSQTNHHTSSSNGHATSVAPPAQALYGRVNWLNIAVIGVLALLCVLTALRMRNLQDENRSLRNELVTCGTREKIFAFLKDPQTEPVVLNETGANPQAAALVYWNETQKTALLNPFGLKPLSADQQYQIWADVDGKMVSIGLISPDLDKYQSLSFMENAQSLNITIEPRGGSKSPTVSRLVANRAI